MIAAKRTATIWTSRANQDHGYEAAIRIEDAIRIATKKRSTCGKNDTVNTNKSRSQCTLNPKP